MNNDRGRFRLKFDVEGHDIDAATYGKVLVNTVILVDEISNELEGFAKFDIRIRAEKKGSYVADLVLQAGAVVGITSGMITPENLLAAKNFASRVVSYLGKCLEFAKALKGESPKSITQKGDRSIVVTGDGNTVSVDNRVINIVVGNDRAKEAIADAFENLRSTPEIKELKVINEKDKPIFEATKGDFPKLAKKVKQTKVKQRSRRVRAVLTPVRQSFERKKKSDFFYAGNQISADIKDEGFWRRIDADEPFTKGDKLVVQLEIQEEYHESLKAYEKKSYQINEVLEHRPTSKQQLLGFEETSMLAARPTRRLLKNKDQKRLKSKN